MIKKTVLVNRRVIEGVGHVEVQFQKQVIDADGTVYVARDLPFHRFVLEVGEDVDFIINETNRQLAGMSLAPIDAAEVEKIKRTCAAEWTPECRAAWNAFKAANRKENPKP